MNYEPVIGLEVHIETKTQSKMFSGEHASYFGQKPNIHTSPTSLGLPGSLPFINEHAIENCIKIGLALGCTISGLAVFERKNYFYPDLPKGYQISQYRWPLCINGELKLDSGKLIRINRVHQEEDTGKLVHSRGHTMIDFNRAGVPLVEVVTEPDFRSVSEIADYAKKLQKIMRYLEVSDADMEKGQMRLEANVSVRSLALHPRGGSVKLPNYRVELKNINSFRFMIAAVAFEIERQTALLENGEKPVQETRGWSQLKRITYTQRVKEEASDYRYFPDPDLPPIRIQEDKIQKIKKGMPELPGEKVKRFINKYALSKYQANILTERRSLADYFEEAIKIGREHKLDAKAIANTLINKKLDRKALPPAMFVKMLGKESKKPSLLTEELEKAVELAISQNPEAARDYKSGRENAMQFLIGAVMKITHGQANPDAAKEVIKKKLRKLRKI